MWVKGRITQDHIARGARGSPESCPLAIMLREATGMQVEVLDRICLYPPFNMGVFYTVWGPKHLTRFITAFDDGKPVTEMDVSLNFKRTKG